MYKKTCRCGKTEKNFKMDIGEFFIAKCCLEAGFDKMGNKDEKKVKTEVKPEEVKVEETKTEEPKSIVEKMTETVTKKKSRRSRKKKD